ncbi:ricin-type beta-trefoil lectin domain protein [Homoserinimonas aerilata]|uniref:ricin-type beta-trefoil lectin domain protein n=1 Tax=Homoserinimonas aerilata TaxID=1162970 RepID=UPI00163A67D3|nr:ricin-type beta-trefoil lectin domain protein [Homoserinimonas aerilata]
MNRRFRGFIAIHRMIDARLSARPREQGMALMSTILFMIMLSGLSLVLLSVILGQIGPAYVAQKGTKTVYAAQAGLQSALGSLRSSSSVDALGDVYGDIGKLPCTIQGDVDGADDSVQYEVQIRYYLDDPTGKNDTWLETHKLNCVPGLGISQQPNFSYVVSRGSATSDPGLSDDAGNRAVAAVYQFKVTNENIPGGHIYDFNKTTCIEAVPSGAGGVVKVNDKVRFVSGSACTDDKDLQKWIYDTDWQIKLAITTADDQPGLCITGPTSGNSSQDVQLQTCRTDATRYNQLWSWEGSHTWVGQKNPISDGTSDWCMSRADSKAGSYYYLQVKRGGCTTFAPDPAAGAGAASYDTNQVVNYEQFGRCLDVTGGQINSTYMIAYPCKQDPRGGTAGINWNHKWSYQEPDEGQTSRLDQQIFVKVNNDNNQKRCLETPSGAGKYPVFKTCNSNSAAQKWDRVYDTGEYSGSYLFIDRDGRCLSADPSDRHDNVWAKITVATCNASELQKWNAPASYNSATFGGFKELGE